jgi:hypothetical protein
MYSVIGESTGEHKMNFCERDAGPYRIYAAALEAPGCTGYVAAVVVSRRGGTLDDPLEAFRDMKLANGHAWPSPDTALGFAVIKARSVIRSEPHRLAR